MKSRFEFFRYLALALKCEGVDEFRSLLEDFAKGSWTLEERAAMSANYTPRVLRVNMQTEDKWKLLEDLGALCWRSNNAHKN